MLGIASQYKRKHIQTNQKDYYKNEKITSNQHMQGKTTK